MSKNAVIKPKRKLPIIWILPVIALIVASWMVYQAEFNKGPLVSIVFDSAEGLQAGKTKIKCRSVAIGMVESIHLSDDYNTAVAKVRIQKSFEELLKSDSKIWVAKPRIDNNGISGMGTILSGAYIEIEPGQSEEMGENFTALSHPPLLQQREGGLTVRLISDDGSSVSPGDPVLYRGFKVGMIIETTFRPENKQFYYEVFIEDPYKDLLCEASRFWNSSGINFEYGVDGFQINTAGLESIISGGVSFDLPPGVPCGEICCDGHEFELHDSRADMLEQPYKHYAEFLLFMDSSVAGLKTGAPVEYRGFQIGSVTEVAPFDVKSKMGSSDVGPIPIPVKIRIDPGRWEFRDTQEGVDLVYEDMPKRVELGLRATLETRNLLTGSRFVTFRYLENAEPAEISQQCGYDVIPTAANEFDQMGASLAEFLKQLEELNLAKTLAEMESTFSEVSEFVNNFDTTLANVDSFLTSEEMLKLPETLNRSLGQLEQTLGGLDPNSQAYQELASMISEFRNAAAEISSYANTLNNKPNALIFQGSQNSDPQPPKE